ncbi:Purple acid phosphatase 18 [Auxenochlorella protothecoides]|uniref:Purple acid phosphatase n=1 Tax=Auxenochlorella protothecoides TaxID=3075 RepID=A0A087SHZ1_AUXPR|nr:Purple acid phosphatase 18 [Auxenochlorella protothecoides]KFM25345.1 Purple acid phosphatase 18 [Auxenochlorella protothecoides]
MYLSRSRSGMETAMGSASFARQALTVVLALACVTLCAGSQGDFSNSLHFVRKAPKGHLPATHTRLARHPSAGPSAPEQIHISLAGPGAVAVNWVTPGPETSSSHSILHRLSRHLPIQLRHARLGRRLCPGTSIVQYGLESGVYTSQARGAVPTCYSVGDYDSGVLHEVVIGLDGPLPASTDIFYRVSGSGAGVWSEEYAFTTPPPVGPASLPYRLGVIGDLGQTEDSLETLEHMVASGPASVMLVGDLSYADGDHERWDTWNRMVSPLTSRSVWMFTEGNHERERASGVPSWLAYTSRFHLPHAASGSGSPLYYSYDLAGAHVVMLGSYTDHGADSDQAEWLAADLAAVDRARTPWLLVNMHAPFYSSNLNHLREAEAMRVSMETLLRQHAVDVVFAGHVHAYERSYHVYDGAPDPCAPIYINIGDGGNREGPDTHWLPRPDWSAWREPSFGHGTLDLLNSTHAQWRWVRNKDSVTAVDAADAVTLVRSECHMDRGAVDRAAAAA